MVASGMSDRQHSAESATFVGRRRLAILVSCPYTHYESAPPKQVMQAQTAGFTLSLFPGAHVCAVPNRYGQQTYDSTVKCWRQANSGAAPTFFEPEMEE